jgi:hypothetical protein
MVAVAELEAGMISSRNQGRAGGGEATRQEDARQRLMVRGAGRQGA